ncbi:MAG: lytic transglycosylase domain-containing protein [Rubrivivax sp.]
MDLASFLALAAACAPLVHPHTAHALVSVESSFNPHAIGVVGGALERQPRNLVEAVATARALMQRDFSFSVGLGQINVRNFDRLGFVLETAFEPCRNLAALQTVLGECHDRAASNGAPHQHAVRQALSCYYSGNFTTGLRDGYVRRVVAAVMPISSTGAAPVSVQPNPKDPS